MHYYQSCHKYLTANGYVPLYDEEQVRQTSSFGGVPDWAYGITVTEVKIAPFRAARVIEAFHCSDHDHDAQWGYGCNAVQMDIVIEK